MKFNDFSVTSKDHASRLEGSLIGTDNLNSTFQQNP